MITREADYAIRSVASLASLEKGKSVSCAQLSEETDVPYRFLRKIVRKLAGAGIVKSRRGRAGGIRLSKKPSQLSLLDVICAIDARGTKLNVCFDASTGCERSSTCRTHAKLKTVQNDLEKHLANISFDQLAACSGTTAR